MIKLREPDIADIVDKFRSRRTTRQQDFQAAYRNFMRPMLNPDATWNIELTNEFSRLDLQMCTAFYCGSQEDIDLANKMTRRAPLGKHNGKIFNIFTTSILCELVTLYRQKMEPETISWCEKVIEEGSGGTPSMSAPDLQFHGYNDNMPAMAVKTLILGGEMLNRQDFTAMGSWKLERFAEQLTRCGLISEYNSPNYTADTILNLMTLHNHTGIPEVKELSGKIVTRMWQDLASHWHPDGHCLAGPFSRSYEHGFNNYMSVLNGVVWLLFGPDISRINMLETINPREGIFTKHNNNKLEHSTRMAWYSFIDDSLLDDETAALFIRKAYPFETIASTEQGAKGDYPFKKATATTYMTKDYSLGSASFGFCNSNQTATVYTTGCGKTISPVLFTRYLVDDETPGRIGTGEWHCRTTGPSEYNSYGIPVTVQSEQTVLASYVPVTSLRDKAVSKLRLGLIAPTSQGQFGSFYDQHGKRLKPNVSYPADQWYGAILGNAVAAYLPLAFSALELPDAQVFLRSNEHYEYLEIVNYDGPERSFSRDELTMILNGGVLELASLDDWSSPGEFLSALGKAMELEDFYLFKNRRTRYRRKALKDRPELMLGLHYSTGFDGSALRIVNGKNAIEPVWQCSGITIDQLPFMNNDRCISKPGIPWHDLTVFNFAKSPWAINH